MNILFLCWRDVKNPRAGGAEVYIFEVGKRLNARGHSVTLFTAAFPGCAPEESIDGVRVIRQGAQVTVQWRFYRWWRRQGQNDGYDTVVETVNTIPFLTPLYIRGGKMRRKALFFQLCGRVWWYESVFPLNVIGFLLEPLYLLAYRRTHVATISESSRKDLVRHGVPGRLVDICPVGIDARQPETIASGGDGLNILFVGRLTPSKRPDHVIKAFAKIRLTRADARLWIVGDGKPRFKAGLERLVRALGLERDVTFFGRVSEDGKARLMREAHVIAVTSVKEGWGLVVTEAAARGTPAVVYDVDGLRDSVRGGVTGVVCGENTPEVLSREVLALAADAFRLEKMRNNARAFSSEFTWEKATEAFERFIGS
ncbi:MAG: glycosyltransferase family 1 protein [Candidatus Anoxymicrobium japonicum]|uniref:Glycosyltransferase family 1 protein n=1 Tax=Candidatus Anoxymicrobium japonicum TaxID=2013648 RepID=A0A2N3G7Y7_9ACTN|nr:MAG: glycosyltransferase family 1 protein [Candidatus Anoxymicrobium japonicum]